MLFLRCLLAGAKVVHTPETLVLYRLGEEGKLTKSKEGHVRRVTHWARFLVKASQEVGFHAEARRRGWEEDLTTDGSDIHGWGEAGQRLGNPSCAAFSNPSTNEIALDCANTSPIRSADAPAVAESKTGIASNKVNQLADSKGFLEGQSQAGLQMDSPNLDSIGCANETRACREQPDKNPVNSVKLIRLGSPFRATGGCRSPLHSDSVKNVFGFRLRAYLAWRDLVNLEKRDSSLEKEIELIWKRSRFSSFRFPVLYCACWGKLNLCVLCHCYSEDFRCVEIRFKSPNF